jgi:hypothetical protein
MLSNTSYNKRFILKVILFGWILKTPRESQVWGSKYRVFSLEFLVDWRQVKVITILMMISAYLDVMSPAVCKGLTIILLNIGHRHTPAKC